MAEQLTMSKKGAVSALLGILVVVLVGVAVAFQVIGQQVHQSTTIFTNQNDTVGDLNVSKQQSLAGFGDSSSFIVDGTGTISAWNDSDCASTALTRHTHFHIINNDSSHTPTFNLTDGMTAHHVCVRYNFRAPSYITGATTRMIVGYLPLLMAVAILSIIAGYLVLKP